MKMRRISSVVAQFLSRACLCLIALFIACSTARAEVPDATWSRLFPTPTSGHLTGVTWGEAGFVAVGFYGEVLHSPDGHEWNRITLNNLTNRSALFNMYDVAYFQGKYVIAGSGVPIWSEDGENWQSGYGSRFVSSHVCAIGDGKIVLLNGDYAFVSTNAVDWETNTISPPLADLTYADNRWFGAGGGSEVYFSTNLVNWTPASFDGNPRLGHVEYGNGVYLVSGTVFSPEPFCEAPVIYYSTNGIDWGSASLTNLGVRCEPPLLDFVDGKFYAFNDRRTIVSTNGVDWSVADFTTNAPAITDFVVSPAGTYVGVGDNILVSTNLLDWEFVSNIDWEMEFYSLAYANNTLVVAGGQFAITNSPTRPETSGLLIFPNLTNQGSYVLTNLPGELTGVDYGQGWWVICGDHGSLFASTDLTNWVDCSFTNVSRLETVTYGNGHYVISGQGAVYHSTSATNWSSTPVTNLTYIASIKFLKDRFIALGGSGMIYVSYDGIQWELQQLPTAEHLSAVTYGKGRFVIGGRYECFISKDGENWRKSDFGYNALGIANTVSSFTYADGWFVARFPRDSIGLSRDGVRWRVVDIFEITTVGISGFFYVNGEVILLDRTALYRGRFTDTEAIKQRLRPLLYDQLEFFGKVGFEYQLEHSSDLIDWEPFSDWKPGADQYFIEEMGDMSETVGFWRYVVRPE